MCAVMVSIGGCSMGESDVFTIYADGGGECWENTDCPDLECHTAPTCIAGVCRALKRERQTVCSIGVCNADWICVPCVNNADCDAANENECYALTCGNDGLCQSRKLPSGSPCLQTENGTCNTGAVCVPN